MINIEFHTDFLTLTIDESDSRLIFLRDLQSEGLTEESQPLTFRIDFSDWFIIEKELRELLDFYSKYPFSIEFDSDGVIGTAKGNYKVIYREYPVYGKVLSFACYGPFLIDNSNAIYQLSEETYAVLVHLKDFKYENRNQALVHLGVFQKLISLTNVETTNKLTSRKIIVPDKIRIAPKLTSDLINLSVEVADIASDELNKRLKNKAPSDRLDVRDKTGTRTSILFAQEQITALEQIDSFNQLNEKDKLEVIQNPITLFDPNTVDLDNFSKRVVNIGFYKPKVYPFISPYKSEWIPGFEITSRTGEGTRRIKLKDQDVLNNFKSKFEEAVNQNKSTITYDDLEISVEDAVIIIDVAQKQLNNPKTPQKGSNETEVLIIKQNDELLEYWSEQSTNLDIEHSFYPIPNLKNTISLKPHQKEGVAWMQALIKGNFQGALLADDMGLGKTIQVLSIIDWYHNTIDFSKPSLIIAPVSLLENWSKEYSNFFNASNIQLEVLHGGIPKAFDNGVVEELQQPNKVYLTNYETVRNAQLNFGAVDFSLVILDEAQKIKTPATLVTNAVKALKSEFNLAMTGTPVENSYLDIWCIMDFCIPGLLSDAKSFAAKYQSPLKSTNTDLQDLGRRLREEIGVFIKRRLKTDIAADLPKKIIKSYGDPMPEKQKSRYLEVIDSYRLGTEEHMLVVLQNLKLISDHPYLIDQEIDQHDPIELINSSSKLSRTMNILNLVESQGDKAIVFAERRNTQRLLQKVIKYTFGFYPKIINGDTASLKKSLSRGRRTRQQIIDEFHQTKGFAAIIMSPIAAGVGLNVTGANHVIHYSRHWNPAKESQATDRAYRIGQTKDVYVHYPQSVFADDFKYKGFELESFDTKIAKLLENKSELATQSLFPTESVEVSQTEAFEAILGKTNKNIEENSSVESSNKLTFKEFCYLKHDLFEAGVAAFYEKMGYDVQLTPLEGDRGADIIAKNNTESLLILVKSSRYNIDTSCINEILSGLPYYNNHHNSTFQAVILTNSIFLPATNALATDKNVKLINQLELGRLYKQFPINSSELNIMESIRLSVI
jgi:SNF2 family DNA or RNA helicase